jgi:hypothetical protein
MLFQKDCGFEMAAPKKGTYKHIIKNKDKRAGLVKLTLYKCCRWHSA